MEQRNLLTAQKLAQIEAETRKENRKELLSLNPSQTALFYGFDSRSTCSVNERQEFRRHTRYVLYDLLDMGISNILIEHSSLFGYYALDELVRQRQKYAFTLMNIHRESEKYRWLHIKSLRLSLIRNQRNIHKLAQCDKLLGMLSNDEWLDLLHNHIALMICSKPPYYRNRSALTTEQFNQWGASFGDKEVTELFQMLNSETYWM